MQIIDINARFGSYPSRYKTTSADDLVADAQLHKVSKTCVVSTTGAFYNDSEGNMETQNACVKYSDDLTPIATLNPKTSLVPKDSAAAVINGDFKAVRFFPHEQGWPIDFAPFAELLSTIAEANLPTIVNCSKPGDATALAKYASKYFCNGSTPVILESITMDTFAEALSAMRSCKELMIETHAIRFPDGLPLLRDSIGAERILFGSGASAQSLGATLQYVTSSRLSDSEKELVLGRNAVSVLGIG
jgi:predicted TIM-barrel fold metal-dependent hydrolase